MIHAAVTILALSTADIEAAVGVDPAMCRIVRISAAGARSEHPPTKPYRQPSGVTASASSHSSGASRSSVNIASSSRDGGASRSRIVADGRAITSTFDTAGCTIVIDERP